MWYIIAAVLLVGASSLVGLNRYMSGGVTKSGGLQGLVQGIDFRSLSDSEIDQLLERLESEDPPDRVMGAMCYAAMAYPEVAEYICPVCGEKTLYSGYETAMIEWQLQGMRRMAENIDDMTDFPVMLDETQFCHFCSGGDIPNPSLVLRVMRSDSMEIENTVSSTDLSMLESFLQGNLYYFTSNDSQEPLREHADRLRQLLGFPMED